MIDMQEKRAARSRVAPTGATARGALLGGLMATALLAGCGSDDNAAPAPTPTPVPTTPTSPAPPPQAVAPSMLKADGTKWVDADGKQVLLKGTNLGNWLVQEY